MSEAVGSHVTHTRRDPCPVCGGDNCWTFDDGATLCLRRESGRRTKSGIGWLHGGDPAGDWRDRLPPPAPARPEPPPPDPALVDEGLRAILAACPLAAPHRDELRRRGLADAEIDTLPVGSLPADGPARDAAAAAAVAALGEAAFGNVPGLYRDRGRPRIWAHAGLLVGVARGDLLVGLVVRPDDEAARAAGKYRQVSSKDRDGGCASGAPCGVLPGEGDRVLVVEGILKSLVVNRRLRLPVVAMPGATITAEVPDLLAELGAAEAWLAFDNDRATNPAVAAAEAGLIADLREADLPVRRLTWPAAYKGLDDALAAGALPVAESGADCAELRAENARLRAELAEARALYRAHLAAIRSPNLGAERVTAAAIVADLAHVPAGEWVPMGHARVAENAGCSESVAPKHVERVKPVLAGAVEIAKRWIPETVDVETGEIRGGHHQTFARRLVPAPVALTAIATAPEPKAGKRNGHGGERVCQRCGSAKLTRHWVDKCDECGHVVAAGKGRPPDPGPPPDAPESRTALGNHHLDGFGDGAAEAGHGEGATPTSSPETVSITADSPTGHNDEGDPFLEDDPLPVARAALDVADGADDPVTRRAALDLLGGRLGDLARRQGREPIPKPGRSARAPDVEAAGDDRWTRP